MLNRTLVAKPWHDEGMCGRQVTDLDRRALGGVAQFLVGLAILLFVPTWTLAYWQAWGFLAVFSTAVLSITLYLMRKDPALLERRMKAGPGAEKEASQKIIQLIAAMAFVAAILVPAIDHRLGWSAVPPSAVVAGDLLVAIGMLVTFLVFKANSFASAIIDVGAGQRLVSTGPYGVVRHPMYAGALIMMLGVPPALGSWWGLLASLAMTLAMIWRLLDEERVLAKSLPGYAGYRDKVRYRLVPYFW